MNYLARPTGINVLVCVIAEWFMGRSNSNVEDRCLGSECVGVSWMSVRDEAIRSASSIKFLAIAPGKQRKL